MAKATEVARLTREQAGLEARLIQAVARETSMAARGRQRELRRLEETISVLSARKVETLRILYLTAASRGDLRVDEEIRRMRAAVPAATHRELVETEHRPAAT